ncbi:MAG: NADH:ubiquinone reductase (Na(+)-transporting) subunit F, partial [Saprospiraceae bacterium]|nr:NADH:ubiquinone reductase (Na(+)-transporting) subunit F [Saprospiraceae bacterium]
MIFLSAITDILLSIGVFSAVILLLAYMLIYAKQKLVPQGEVKIIINGDEANPILVKPGSSLLSTLSDKSIFLPSACGGGGTCAMCECHVDAGGGDVLPTELNHLTRKEVAEHKRLACQVKVRQDMHIRVPEEIFGIKKWECEVVSNYNVATFIKEFVVKLPEGEHLEFESGGYVQIDVPVIECDYKTIDITSHPRMGKKPNEFQPDWDKFKLWDLKMKNDEPQFRAYSMANHPAEGNIVMLNIRIATPPWDRAANNWMQVNPGVCSSYTFT